MAKIFYDHLVGLEEISAELKGYHLQQEEYEELIRIADETLHHHVLNIILTRLPKEKHQLFLESFHTTPHEEKLLDFLKQEATPEIEAEIAGEAKKIKSEILSEIRRAKRK